MNLNDNIRSLFSKVEDRPKFLSGFSKEVNESESEIIDNWLTGNVPEDKIDFTIMYLQNFILNENSN